MDNINTLYTKVEKVLAECPAARDSDITLFERLVLKYYPGKVKYGDRGGKRVAAVCLSDLFNLPRITDIARHRRTIQNTEKRFVPTSWEVAQFRRWRQEDWYSALGYAKIHKDQLVMV